MVKKAKKKAKQAKVVVLAKLKQVEAKASKLTPKQQRFCEEYILDLNATQAALRAGYSAKCIHNQGPANLLKPIIKTELQRLIAKRSKRTLITADNVVIELAKVAFSNIQDYLTICKDGEIFLKNFDDIEREKLAAVESINISTTMNKDDIREYTTTQFKLCSKLNALEKLGKHLGIYQKDNEQKAPITLIDIVARMCGNGSSTD